MQFPKGFLKEAFDAVKAKGGVCISDEVQTGFGRTGEHYWGFEGHGVMPDMVVMAKGTSMYFSILHTCYLQNSCSLIMLHVTFL